MDKLRELFSQYGPPGWVLALTLLIVIHGLIWKSYLWFREIIATSSHPSVFWILCALCASLLTWLFLLLVSRGERYPGMVRDALLGGCLLTVAATLQELEVRSILSREGFGSAGWVTFLCTCGFLIRSTALSGVLLISSEDSSSDVPD